MSGYPSALDNYPTNRSSTSPTRLVGLDTDEHADALNKIQAELGTDPSGSYSTVAAAIADKQPLDSDLTDIAALAPANDSIIQRKSGIWVARSMAQVKTDLALVKGDVGLGNVDNTSDANKPVSTAQSTAFEPAFSTWKDFGPPRSTNIPPSLAADTYLLYAYEKVALNTAASAFCVAYLDPADYTASTRTVEVRFRVTYAVGGTGPARTLTFNFAKVSTWTTAGSTARAGVASLNAALCTTNVASPAANTQGHLESSTGTLTAGYWVWTVVVAGGATAANSNVEVMFQPQYRQV